MHIFEKLFHARQPWKSLGPLRPLFLGVFHWNEMPAMGPNVYRLLQFYHGDDQFSNVWRGLRLLFDQFLELLERRIEFHLILVVFFEVCWGGWNLGVFADHDILLNYPDIY